LVLAIGVGSTRFVDDRLNEISDEEQDYEASEYVTDSIEDTTEVKDDNIQTKKWMDYDQMIKFVTTDKPFDKLTWEDIDEVIDKVVVKGVDMAKEMGKGIIRTIADHGERLNNTGNRFGEWGNTLHKIGSFLNKVGTEINDVSTRLDTMDANEVKRKLGEWKEKVDEIHNSAGEQIGAASGMAVDYLGEVTGQDNLREKVVNSSDAIIESGIFVAKEIKKLIENPKQLTNAATGVVKIARKVGQEAGKRYDNVKDMIHVAGEELAKDIQQTVKKHAEKNETQGTIDKMRNIQEIMMEAGKELAADIQKTVDKHVNDEETKETIERLKNVQGIMFEAGDQLADDIKKQLGDHVKEETIEDFVTEAKWSAKNFWDRASSLLG